MPDHIIRLPREAGIAEARSLAKALVDALDQAQGGDTLVLDGTELRQLDSPIAQLLVAFLLEAQGSGHPVRIEGISASRLLPASLGADQLDRKTASLLEALDAGSRGNP